MRIFISALIMLLFTFMVSRVEAQPVPPNCPPAYSAGYDIVGDSISFCQDGVNLQIIPTSTLKNTDSYSVDPIPYNPYPWVGANALFVGQDDIWSGVIPLPFPFCFFGQKYNSVIIGANGQVGFDLTQANAGNPWASNGWVAPNNNTGMNNTIMAPFHDVNPGVIYAGTHITWDIYGTAPCRYMVISWDSVPMFSCTAMLASQQVVLFESTYLIDINIKQKPLCSGWNGGTAHEGIQNATGTVAFMVPGRNGGQWTANNDSYRFTPSGLASGTISYTWKDVPTGTVLGTGNTLSYFPVANTQVTVDMQVVTLCDTIQAALRDTIDIIVTGQVTSSFNTEVHLGCDEDTIKFTNTSVSTAGGTPLYVWYFGDGVTSTAANPTHVYANQGIYTINLVANDNGCLDTSTAIIDLNHPINAYFLAFGATNPPHQDSTCLNSAINFDGNGVPNTNQSSFPIGNITFEWNWGDGQIDNSGLNPLASHIYIDTGSFSVLLTITDTLGCIDTFRHSVYVDATPYLDFFASDVDICVGDAVFFSDTMTANTLKFTYDFGDNFKLVNVHNPSHSWDQPNPVGFPYQVTLTGEYAICPDDSVTIPINVNDYPRVNLGADTMFCPGLTGSILLTNTNNSSPAGTTYLWNTGSTNNSILVADAGRFWLKASNGKCSTSDSIWIKRDCYINIPNSFSPDGDGLNDYFLPRELLSSGLRTFKMNIYNRWGENIFTTSSIEGRGWDGYYGGKKQPMGVYVYTIDVEFINGIKKTFKGNVTLVR